MHSVAICRGPIIERRSKKLRHVTKLFIRFANRLPTATRVSTHDLSTDDTRSPMRRSSLKKRRLLNQVVFHLPPSLLRYKPFAKLCFETVDRLDTITLQDTHLRRMRFFICILDRLTTRCETSKDAGLYTLSRLAKHRSFANR